MKKLTIPIQFYVTEEDNRYLCDLSRRMRMSKSKVLRLLLRFSMLKEAPPADYKRLIREIRAVGNNLNQLLVVARVNGVMNIPDLKKELERLREVEKSISVEFKTERRAWGGESGSSENLGY